MTKQEMRQIDYVTYNDWAASELTSGKAFFTNTESRD